MSSDLNTPPRGLPMERESSTTERMIARSRIKMLHGKYSSLAAMEESRGKSHRSISEKLSRLQRVGERSECPLNSSCSRMPRLSEGSVNYEILLLLGHRLSCQHVRMSPDRGLAVLRSIFG